MKLIQKIRGTIGAFYLYLNTFYDVHKLREVLKEVLVFFIRDSYNKR